MITPKYLSVQKHTLCVQTQTLQAAYNDYVCLNAKTPT